jgi:hypothetical protein
MTTRNLTNMLMPLEQRLTMMRATPFAVLYLTKGHNMDKSEILWAVACVFVFAFIGVLLAWRG